MATDRMYDLAFKLKKMRLWKKLRDDELFAVSLPDGETGFCCVMGKGGEHYALALYVGDRGYQSYWQMRDLYEYGDDIDMTFMPGSQVCLQCSYESMDYISTPEMHEVQDYAKRNGIRLSGRNAFPQFSRFDEGRLPRVLTSEEDSERICEALCAAIALGSMLEESGKKELGLAEVNEDSASVPVLRRNGDGWEISRTVLPSPEMVYPKPEMEDELMVARIRRKKKTKEWECGMMRSPEPVVTDGHGEEIPFFPLMLLSIELGREKAFEPIISDLEEDAEQMMTEFAKRLSTAKELPSVICCRDERTLALLEDLCRKTGIGLLLTGDMEALDEVMEGIIRMADDPYDDDEPLDVQKVFSELAAMPEEEFIRMPARLMEGLKEMEMVGLLPEDLAKRVRKLSRRKK